MPKDKDHLIQRRVLIGTISNYLGQFVLLGTGFVLTPFVLSHLGPTAYGLWVLVGSVVSYSALLDFGLFGAIIKYIAEYRAKGEHEQAQRLLATALSLYLLLGVVAIALSVVVAPSFPALFRVPAGHESTAFWLVILMGVGMGLSIPCMTALAVLRGLQRYDIVNAVDAVGALLVAVGTVAVLLAGGGVLGVVAVNITVPVIMQLPAIWAIHRVAPELRFGVRGASWSMVRMVIGYSSPLFVMDVAGRLKTKTDEIVIGAFLPVSLVTPYSVARRLSEVSHLLTKQFMKVLLPLASELHAENDLTRLRLLYTAGTRLTLVIFLPIGGALVFLAGPVLTAWVGAEYASSAPLVVVLALASLMATSIWPATAVLQAMARHRWLAVTAIGSGIGNLVLSIFLVQRLGLMGVALGTLIPTAIECWLITLPYAMWVIGVSPATTLREVIAPALLPAIPMALTLYTLDQWLAPTSLPLVLVIAGLGLAVYALAYLTLGASHTERQAYRGVALTTLRFAEARLRRPG